MKLFIFIFSIVFSANGYAHHSKEHLMLMQNVETIILNTQQGSEGGLFWLLWTVAFILILLGFVRWWKSHS